MRATCPSSRRRRGSHRFHPVASLRARGMVRRLEVDPLHGRGAARHDPPGLGPADVIGARDRDQFASRGSASSPSSCIASRRSRAWTSSASIRREPSRPVAWRSRERMSPTSTARWCPPTPRARISPEGSIWPSRGSPVRRLRTRTRPAWRCSPATTALPACARRPVVPFSSAKKWSGAVLAGDGREDALVMGAAQFVLIRGGLPPLRAIGQRSSRACAACSSSPRRRFHGWRRHDRAAHGRSGSSRFATRSVRLRRIPSGTSATRASS